MNPAELPLRDLHLPAAVGWWPLAPGWWVLIGLLAIALLYLGFRAWRRWRYNAPRRYALAQFKAFCNDYTQHGNAVQFSRKVSELLRRTMLAYAPRAELAGLTGEAWLAWLDRDLDRSHFLEGDGRVLIEWPYRDPDTPIDRSDVAALVDAVRLRLSTDYKQVTN